MTILIPAYENDELKPLEKMLVHRQGLKHLAISIFILADGKIFYKEELYQNIILQDYGQILVALILSGTKILVFQL